ncbi:hypothetical protein Gasu2_45330 [Galdieria sulphuraria]|nr:hypothetical protein Gasu2_45330 [Galdieria sulphuraria]
MKCLVTSPRPFVEIPDMFVLEDTKLQHTRSYRAFFLYSGFSPCTSLPKPFSQRALLCRNISLRRDGVIRLARIALLRERVKFSCLTVKCRENFEVLWKFVCRNVTNESSSLPERNGVIREETRSTPNNILKKFSPRESVKLLYNAKEETFIQMLQKGQRQKQEQPLSQEHKEQLIYLAKLTETSRSKRTKAVYFLFSMLFLTVSLFLSAQTRQYCLSLSKSVGWIWLLFDWERHFGSLLSFVTPLLLFIYTFFFSLSFRDTYRRYILSYFLVLFAQGIASIFSFVGFGYIRIWIEIVLYGIYIPVVLWAWSDLKVELEMAHILDKRYSFLFTFWRILRTKTLLPRNETWVNSLKCIVLGFSRSSVYDWKSIIFARVGYVLIYCYILYSLLFFTVFVDCGSEFYSRHDISPFTQLFLYLGLLDRDLSKRETRRKKVAWTGFLAAVDKKLERMIQFEKYSVDIRDSANYPLKNQSDVFSFIANFEVPWEDEPELRDEVLLPFREYLDNVALAIKARNEVYPKSDEKKLLPGSTRELENAMLLFSEAVPPNREHYDVERLYDEPEGNISVNSDKTTYSDVAKYQT